MSDKTYINGLFIKKKELKFGEVIGVSINVKSFIDELSRHQNEKGYVNITFMNRKEADKNGNNMYAVLDTYEKQDKPF
jgi:ABC-type Na+ transport system ATPase subunit NatA